MDKVPKNQPNYYIDQLKKIDENDLKFVEKDLAFYEKVSLVFLLYGDDKNHACYALQNLLVLSNTPEESSELLFNYTKINKNWRPMLIEALTIIKENKILRKLGFNIKELRATFLPHISQATLFIHPILKALYIMCEQLTQIESGKIIIEMKNLKDTPDSYLRFYDNRYLEIFLLDWISKSIINIGEWLTNDYIYSSSSLNNSDDDNNDLSKIINLLPLYQCLKICDLDYVKEMLQSTVEHMTKKLVEIKIEEQEKSQIKQLKKPKGKELLNRNENDSALTVNNNNFERKESFTINRDECYLIRKEWAGFILIINQENFHEDKNPEVQELLPKKPLRKRRGTDMDTIRLEDTFSSFGYRPIIKSDLTNIQILNEVRDVVKRSEIMDSVIVCILSHGFQGAVYGSNSLPVEIKKIENILTSNCLLGKPKLLIIQACQGEDLQKAELLKNFEYDSPQSSKPAFCDILTATSTVPGFASVRHIEKGSWFIQTLCKVIDTQAERKHMLDLLTSVKNEVSTKRGSENECMVPLTYTTLTKSFFLPRRY